MDLFSLIFAWLSEHEAALSAAVAIMVLSGALVAGLRAILRRHSQPTTKTAPEEDPLLALIRE